MESVVAHVCDGLNDKTRNKKVEGTREKHARGWGWYKYLASGLYTS